MGDQMACEEPTEADLEEARAWLDKFLKPRQLRMLMLALREVQQDGDGYGDVRLVIAAGRLQNVRLSKSLR